MERLSHRQETIIEQRNKSGSIIAKYAKGKYLGKGGFAKCYEFTNLANNRKYAAKIIEKASLTRSKAKEKLASQIEIHRSVKSTFVVDFQRSFEDSTNVYILLELCPNQTLNQLIKRRKRITEIEARYYLHQIAMALKDFQEQMIIHRDLKLGNLLLTGDLEIRISDFGLAAKLGHPGERRKTMCGTPNYIAPQILENLSGMGHSYEVDIWSLGVIAYACLVGRPPFETNDVKATYSKIKACNYSFPDHVPLSTTTKHFISKMLQKDPRHRLTVQEVLGDQFFTLPIPDHLPHTLLACPPNSQFMAKYQQHMTSTTETRSRRDSSIDNKTERTMQKGESVRQLVRTNSIHSIQQAARNNYCNRAASTAALTRGRMLSSIRRQTPKPLPTNHPQQPPHVWVTYFQQNAKFGVAYQLNSNAVGMRYNDSTTLIANSNFNNLKYIDFLVKQQTQRKQQIFQIGDVPNNLNKKFKIISYYHKELRNKKERVQGQLNNQQIIMRERLRYRQTPESAMMVWVTKHLHTSKCNLFFFNTKDRQIIFQDSTQLLFNKDNITYVNKVGQRRYFKREQQQSQPDEVKKRLRYADSIMQNLRQNRNQNVQPNPSSNKENQQPLVRSSSTVKIEKPQGSTGGVMLRGSASTSRIPNTHLRILKY